MKIVFIILSGGKGTRLRPLTFFIQKTLLPVMKSKRIIDFSIKSSDVRGLFDVESITYVNTRYKFKQVTRYLEKKFPEVFIVKESKALDTGGSILQNWNFISQAKPDIVIVLNGDHYINLPVEKLIQYFKTDKNLALLLVCIESDAKHHDYINLESEELFTNFQNRNSNIAYTGICIFKFDVLKERIEQFGIGSYNLTKDIVEWVYKYHKSDLFHLDNEWKDLGTWKRYIYFIIQNVFRKYLMK